MYKIYLSNINLYSNSYCSRYYTLLIRTIGIMITYYATEINLTRVDKIVIEYAFAESIYIYIYSVINNYKFSYIFTIFIRRKQRKKKNLYIPMIQYERKIRKQRVNIFLFTNLKKKKECSLKIVF